MVWGGISASNFIDKQTSYDGSITKDFNWGYYFKFPWRKFSGVKQSSGKLYGLVTPNASSDIASYSANSYYSVNGTEANGQFFYTYMTASDMARELKFIGCEIPLSEVMVGDLVFFKASRCRDERLDDTVENTIEDGFFLNINHVAVVTSVTNLLECNIQFTDCSSFWGTNTISNGSINDLNVSTRRANGAHAADMTNRIVMVARHPYAFGITNSVPSTISSI